MKYKQGFLTAMLLGTAMFLGGLHMVQVEDSASIRILVPNVEQPAFDGKTISEAVNEYVSPLIGGSVELEFVKFEQYSQTVRRYEMTEQLPDVLFLWFEEDTSSLIRDHKLAALENLAEEYGKDLLTVVSEEALSANTYDGHLYAIPTVRDQVRGTCFEYRASIAEEYNLDMSKVHTYQDLTEIFDQLSQQNSEIIPCDMHELEYYDPLGDSLGVLLNYTDSPAVTNLYESQEFEEYVKTLRIWKQSDYLLDPDLGFDSSNRYVSSPEIFGKFSTDHPALTYVDSVDAGETILSIPLTETYVTTDTMRGISYSISEQSENKELAMRFLNLLYTDPDLINLLTYGIRDVNYQMIDEEHGVIGFLEGTTRKNSNYYQFRGYNWGNEFLSYLWESYPLDLWQQEQRSNQEAVKSIAFGFTYDSSPVAKETADCLNIANQYLALLKDGEGDTDTLLKEFRLELHLAGIDKIIKEKQRQLNQFLRDKEGS